MMKLGTYRPESHHSLRAKSRQTTETKVALAAGTNEREGYHDCNGEAHPPRTHAFQRTGRAAKRLAIQREDSISTGALPHFDLCSSSTFTTLIISTISPLSHLTPGPRISSSYAHAIHDLLALPNVLSLQLISLQRQFDSLIRRHTLLLPSGPV